jgi:hypothetical protein
METETKIPLQQTFDIVVKHLLEQGKRASLDDGECVYRTPAGLKCAAGCLIPDELYDPGMEGFSVIGPHSLAGQVIQRLGHDIVLVSQLQRMHDTELPESWAQCLQVLALTHNLQY